MILENFVIRNKNKSNHMHYRLLILLRLKSYESKTRGRSIRKRIVMLEFFLFFITDSTQGFARIFLENSSLIYKRPGYGMCPAIEEEEGLQRRQTSPRFFSSFLFPLFLSSFLFFIFSKEYCSFFFLKGPKVAGNSIIS